MVFESQGTGSKFQGNRLPPFALSALKSYSIFFTIQKQGKNQLSDFNLTCVKVYLWCCPLISQLIGLTGSNRKLFFYFIFILAENSRIDN